MNNSKSNFNKWIVENILETADVCFLVLQKSEYAGSITETRQSIFIEKDDALKYAHFLRKSVKTELKQVINERLLKDGFEKWIDFYENYDSDSIEIEIWDSFDEIILKWIIIFSCNADKQTIDATWQEVFD